MKKLRANSILIACVFGVTILMLCTFGADAAYVILSRYKLQKITEQVAYEYASTKSRDYDYSLPTEQETPQEVEARERIVRKYRNIYNTLGSGVMIFDINSLEYKSNRIKKETVVRVKTTSKVMPAFLRHLGVKEILIHAVACAKTNRITMKKRINYDNTNGANDEGFDYAGSDKVIAMFPSEEVSSGGGPAGSDVEFVDDVNEYNKDDVNERNKAGYIISKNLANGDFSIKYEYVNVDTEGNPDPTSTMETGGGFFILAGYDFKDDMGENQINWVDIGNKAINKPASTLKRVCVNPTSEDGNWANFEQETDYDTQTQCYYCVDAASEKTITFSLNKDITGTKDTGGRINRISRLRIYKAGGAGNSSADSGTGEVAFKNPCDPDFTSSAVDLGGTGTASLPSTSGPMVASTSASAATELIQPATSVLSYLTPSYKKEVEIVKSERYLQLEEELKTLCEKSIFLFTFSDWAEYYRIVGEMWTEWHEIMKASRCRGKGCIPNKNNQQPFYTYFNRPVDVELTILNNVNMIRQSDFRNFVEAANEKKHDNDTNGIWTNNDRELR